MLGTLIGQYRVQRLLGEGGMGEVYEAVHEQLGRRVAIKILHPEYARNTDALNRFFNEARAVNVVNHPGLVQISEYGQLPSGSAYLVMEYLDGETLSARLKRARGRLPEREVLALTRQLASVLATTHASGIVHRDLKPSNIMLVSDPAMPSGERLKLLDFGIAKISARSQSANEPRTRTGLFMGTPLYMSPEQCRGAGQVDDKADVYSFGVICYQLLAGRPPFAAEGDAVTVAMHLYEAPPPLQGLAPQASEGLAALVHRMLLKDKHERPSMKEVEQQLQLLESGRPSQPAIRFAPTVATPLVERAEAPAAPAAPTNPSTMQQSAGQVVVRRSFLPHILAGIALLVGTGIGAVTLLGLQRSPQSVRVEAEPSPVPKGGEAPAVATGRTVHWAVMSIPPGAEVVRTTDQQVLGRTPWESEEPSGQGKLELSLRLSGFRSRSVILDRNRSGVRQETLEPLAPQAHPRAESPKPPKKAPAPTTNPCPEDAMCRSRATQGLAHYSSQHYDQALREFQAAYTFAQGSPRLLIHIGLCYMQLGRPKQALEFYQSYQRAVPTPDADLKGRLSLYIAEAKAALASSRSAEGR